MIRPGSVTIAAATRSSPLNQGVVLARAPTPEGGLIKLAVHPETLRSAARLKNGKNDKLGQYCGLIHGNVWAATTEPDQFDEGTPGLTEPVAVFQGLKRARNDDAFDMKTFIYVTNPVQNYCYPSRNAYSGGPARVPVPPNSVFVVYVDYGPEFVDELRAAVHNMHGDVCGIVVDWDWVPASPSDPRVPVNATGASARYFRRVWDQRDG